MLGELELAGQDVFLGWEALQVLSYNSYHWPEWLKVMGLGVTQHVLWRTTGSPSPDLLLV